LIKISAVIINVGHILYSDTVKPDVVTKDNTWKIKSILLIDDNLPPIEKRNTRIRRPIIIAKKVLASELEK
jgi:hypothetical protein